MTTGQTPADEGANAGTLTGQTVTSKDGKRLGKLDHIYRGRRSGAPAWGLVTSRFHKRHLVPLDGATPGSDGLHVAAGADEVRHAPPDDGGTGDDLAPETESALERHYSHENPAYENPAYPAQPAPAGAPAGVVDHTGRDVDDNRGAHRHRSVLSMQRSRGAVSGTLLVPLGIWGALIPFIGPYFNVAFGTDQTWAFSGDRFWLSILPGIVVVLGGLLLAPSANRITGGLGAWLALAGGIWFVIGPAMSQLWGAGGAGAPIGQPLGGAGMRTLEQIVAFYGLGALITALAAFALGRLTVRSVKDMGPARSSAQVE
ncbi:PRC-barrel domain containing protein [Amycolatopsis palatopharyngis]|uniref:PRC-barrel domain containing protein n=1 Tax=Amycolatopsis palatopharyngis TaxID=187982 RepID=UPI000E23C994|nr:PRC-barrel domain containing protein [Amycolatopsis palatopharyngis]